MTIGSNDIGRNDGSSSNRSDADLLWNCFVNWADTKSKYTMKSLDRM